MHEAHPSSFPGAERPAQNLQPGVSFPAAGGQHNSDEYRGHALLGHTRTIPHGEDDYEVGALPSFDGIETQSIQSSRGDDASAPLTPFQTRQKLLEAFSPVRLGCLILLVLGGMICMAVVDIKKFSAWAHADNVQGYEACLTFCAQLQTDDKLAATFGGHSAICDTNLDENQSPYVEVCNGLGGKKSCRGATRLAHEAKLEKPGDFVRCNFKVVKPFWKALVTSLIFISVIGLIIQDLPGQILLMGGASILCLLDIITRDELFKGISSSGVTSLAVLFPISEAIQETGIMDYVVGRVLGSPKTAIGALFCMMFPVALLSAFLNNTATVALMIPILCTWARRLNLHPGKLLMPLSFAAQLGGSLTVLGSSTCLVTQSVVAPAYMMQTFDLALVGAPLMISMTFVIAILANTPLLRSSADDGGRDACVDASNAYTVIFVVEHGGGLAGKSIDETGLKRVPGVVSIDRVGLSASDVGDETARGLDVVPLEPDDQLRIVTSVRGLIALRSQGGIRLQNATHLELLGGRRRSRFLYEVSVAIESEFCCTQIITSIERLRQELGAAFVAGPKGTDITNPEPHEVLPGSALLFEADEAWVDLHARGRWQLAFSLVRQIPKSSPLRVGGPVDDLRGLVVVIGMVVLIGLCSFPQTGVRLDFGGAIFLMMLVGIRSLTVEQVFNTVNINILLIISGAMAFGEALQKTGIVSYIADNLMAATVDLGKAGVIGSVYALSVVLSMFINNGATVAILGPMVVSIAQKDPTLPLNALAWTLTYGAGSCFTTPLGYQTNLMVMPDGKYKMPDFLRFGIFIQIIHMAFTLGFVMAYLQLW
eukprot:CAMPEP_0206429060 /NCGR_PEP_ID=MMETSP0324_2-20121206/6019_1 /ASSEMBLY_ACC=CAM_ASM_000836 /TAXON_ID=2866 /ORGANISM="Crypthecodinium cohnii, Strain Seligo" /LENGTH=823 /DNA_ID=CAMNT_0053894675 /DNA_START=23 /DNA_END=2491 /DNA_ORIENTATION=+